MALTQKLGIVVDCFPNKRHQEYPGDIYSDDPKTVMAAMMDNEYFVASLSQAENRLRQGMDRVFAEIKQRNLLFANKPETRIVDIGSGEEGSGFANKYVQEFPGAEIVFLDRSNSALKKLAQSNRLCAVGENMPFRTGSFDVGSAMCVLLSSNLLREARRVIRHDGALVFNHGIRDDDVEIGAMLAENGFSRITHLCRVIWMYNISTDFYMAQMKI